MIARFLIALVFIVLPGITSAVGLGQIKLYSYLDEPLDAEIEIIAAEEVGADRLLASIASIQDFQRAGIQRPYLLSKLRFEIQTTPDRTFIKVTSLEPIKQPSLEFITDLTWPGGRLVRGYTILLDPASMGTLEKRSQHDPANKKSTENIILDKAPNYESLFEEPSVKENKAPTPKAPPVTIIESTKSPADSISPQPTDSISPPNAIDNSKEEQKPQIKLPPTSAQPKNSLFLVSGLALLLAVFLTLLGFKRFRFSSRTAQVYKTEIVPNKASLKLVQTENVLFEEEMPLKLNLAKQYLDILDVNAAKEILDEIITRGSEKEQKEAIHLLSTLTAISSKS